MCGPENAEDAEDAEDVEGAETELWLFKALVCGCDVTG